MSSINTPLSNLPLVTGSNDSADQAKRFFNTYYKQGITVSSDAIDAAVTYFIKRGFSESAAQSVATVLLSQAKIEGVNVFTLLETLKELNGIQLSVLVTEILNYNRLRISILGTKLNNDDIIEYELRNVIP